MYNKLIEKKRWLNYVDWCFAKNEIILIFERSLNLLNVSSYSFIAVPKLIFTFAYYIDAIKAKSFKSS